jgi:hypothetical protein
MNEWACNQGCFVCGPAGQRLNHVNTECCRSTQCHHDRWRAQITTWLTTEEKFNTTLWLEVEKQAWDDWLAAEVEFREELAEKPRVYVRHERRDPNDPTKARADARKAARAKARADQ